MIVNNLGAAGTQLSTDTTIEIDDYLSSETVVYNQQQLIQQTAGLQSPSFAFTIPQPHRPMQAGLHEKPSDNIDLGTHLTTSTYSLPHEQIFQSLQQIRSTEQSSHYKLPSQKQKTGEQTKSYTDQWFYRPHNPNNQTINDFQSEKHSGILLYSSNSYNAN